jgi:hypothetical protein
MGRYRPLQIAQQDTGDPCPSGGARIEKLMKDAAPQTVHWTVLADTDEALALLDIAARSNGFGSPTLEASGVRLEIPRSLRKRRPASRLAGAVTQTERGTEIIWTCGADTLRAQEYLLAVEAALPAGKMQYHGMIEAAAASGVVLEGRTAFRNVVGNLGRDELVLAVARGWLDSEACVLAMTDQRLLLVKDDALGHPRLDAPLDSIGGLVLGKKSTGETVRIRIGPATVTISHMGHGEGHGITAKFRQWMTERARTTLSIPALE